jgi:hypothetical protein
MIEIPFGWRESIIRRGGNTMAILRFLLKIPAIPMMLICRIITVVIDLAAKVSCLVLGPGS